jgi:hypothetical protein
LEGYVLAREQHAQEATVRGASIMNEVFVFSSHLASPSASTLLLRMRAGLKISIQLRQSKIELQRKTYENSYA